jgi:POT family proton-dependent oligopeptide transporter
MFKNQPKGLPVLFFTEMWERFGFYLMLGIFTLYMIDPKTNGGMGFSELSATDIYGTYIALVYLTPFLGGLLADRVLGYRKAINLGGILMGLGYMGLAFFQNTLFYVSLLFIIVGNGFFKPNISTLVGNIYNDEKYKPYKDSGFNIFYMGINIGAFVCNFIAAYLRNHYSWGWAFFAAGVGMFIGLIWFWSGTKHIVHADVKKPIKPEDMPISKILITIFVPAGIFGMIGWFIPQLLFGHALIGSHSTDAFLFASIPVVYFYASLWKKARSKEDKDSIGALLAVFSVVIIFWAIFHQNGSALTLWAKNYTDRQLPKSVERIAEVFKFTETVKPDTMVVVKKDGHGAPILDANGKEISEINVHPYFQNLPKSEWPKEGKSLKLISTEIFQSVNPFFVVVLTPLVVGFFGMLRKKGKEPSTPTKIGLGMLITALSTTVMMLAVINSNNGEVKSSALYLILSYAIITIGELCLSPMGLALVSKLSPPRLTSLMMGGWFLSTSIGNKLSGVLSGLMVSIDNKLYFFLINFVGALFGALLIFIMLKWLRRVLDQYTK